jgi:UDP-N-acetyl-D-mannosaminuronate dehydrogenase
MMVTMQEEAKDQQITVGVYGLGCEGLELALTLGGLGYHVIASDPDPDRIEILVAGFSYIREFAHRTVREQIESEHLAATWDLTRFEDAPFVLLCPPIPLYANTRLQNGYIVQLFKKLEPHLTTNATVGVHQAFVQTNAATVARTLRLCAIDLQREDIQIVCPVDDFESPPRPHVRYGMYSGTTDFNSNLNWFGSA